MAPRLETEMVSRRGFLEKFIIGDPREKLRELDVLPDTIQLQPEASQDGQPPTFRVGVYSRSVERLLPSALKDVSEVKVSFLGLNKDDATNLVSLLQKVSGDEDKLVVAAGAASLIPKQIRRREFLKLAALASGGAVVANELRKFRSRFSFTAEEELSNSLATLINRLAAVKRVGAASLDLPEGETSIGREVIATVEKGNAGKRIEPTLRLGFSPTTPKALGSAEEELHKVYLPAILVESGRPRVSVDAGVYPCPDNVNSSEIATLPKNTQIEPLARYGDFVQIRYLYTASGMTTTLQEGFVGGQFLVNVDIESLPLLSKEDVPWIENFVFSPLSSLEIENPTAIETFYIINPFLASSTEAREDIRIDVSMNIQVDPSAPQTSSTGIWFDNGEQWEDENSPNLRRLHLIYFDKGPNFGWVISYQKGSTLEFFEKLPFIDKNGNFSLWIDKSGQNVKIRLPNGQEREIPLQESLYFTGRTMELLAQVGPGTRIDFAGLFLFQAPSGEYVDVQTLPYEPLRELATGRITIGGPIVMWPYLNNPKLEKTLAGEFDIVASTQGWSWIEQFPDHYDFGVLDQIAYFASKNGMRLRQGLVWFLDLPSWLENGNFTRDELISIMQDYIRTLVDRYHDKIQEWVVVNEALWDGNFVENFWYQNIGPEYIEIALRTAREADPNAALILNFDRNEEINQQSDGIYSLIADLKAKGVPVDGVGMEMHLSGTNSPNKESVKANMRRFKELGVDVYITEFDVNMYGVSSTLEEKQAFQAQIYKDMLEACLESEACRSFTMWRFTDAYIFGQTEMEAPGIFDTEFNPKPAYFALNKTLQDFRTAPT